MSHRTLKTVDIAGALLRACYSSGAGPHMQVALPYCFAKTLRLLAYTIIASRNTPPLYCFQRWSE